MAEVRTDDTFTWWYRFRTVLVLNLLYVAGPATLENSQNPRVQLEREYRRRQAVARAAKHGGPVEIPDWEPQNSAPTFDPVPLMLVGAGLVVVFLVVWLIASAR